MGINQAEPAFAEPLGQNGIGQLVEFGGVHDPEALDIVRPAAA